MIARDVWWLGTRYVSAEPCFVLRDVDPEEIDTAFLMSDEVTTFVGYRFVTRDDLDALDGRLENPDLVRIVAGVAPDSPWAR